VAKCGPQGLIACVMTKICVTSDSDIAPEIAAGEGEIFGDEIAGRDEKGTLW